MSNIKTKVVRIDIDLIDTLKLSNKNINLALRNLLANKLDIDYNKLELIIKKIIKQELEITLSDIRRY